jgi:hypothetical protein
MPASLLSTVAPQQIHILIKKFFISLSSILLQRLLLHPRAIQLGLQGLLGLLQRLNLLPMLKGLFEKQRVEGLEVLELL